MKVRGIQIIKETVSDLIEWVLHKLKAPMNIAIQLFFWWHKILFRIVSLPSDKKYYFNDMAGSISTLLI